VVEYWRLTRTRHTRRVYDALKTLGITATRLYEYEVGVDDIDGPQSPALPDDTRIDRVPASQARARGLDIDFSIPVDLRDDEWVMVASADGRPVARTVVTDASAPYEDALERAVPVAGAYVRKVFVVPDRRGEGVASATLRAALSLARDDLGVKTATALIAADNRPSRRLFEACGFERGAVHEYVRVGPFSRYRRRDR
jgi:RimJ/RimL family protein N-acetyltransferase